MDSSPPPPYTSPQSNPRSRTKSASRLARTSSHEPPPTLSLDLVSYSPKNTNPISLHDLLLLSPSPAKRPKAKNRNPNLGSPRNGRRSRRRIEQEEKDLVNVDDMVFVANNKVKKRRHSGRSKKEKLISCPSIPSPKGNDDDYGCNFDRIGLLVYDLIMWNDIAKSTLWFGLGSLCVLSSCFTTGVSYSVFSLISQLGLLFLGISFFSNTISQRNGVERKGEVKLKEDDILRAARVVLPAANFVLSKTRELFSGEPSMTLKLAPLLLVGAEYGHLITFKRLCALGFFISFTIPKLFSTYSIQIHAKVEYAKTWALEAWGACSHKKVYAASAVTAFWNLTSLKTRVFAAFMCLVILRWYRQHLPLKEGDEQGHGQGQQQEKLTLAESMIVD